MLTKSSGGAGRPGAIYRLVTDRPQGSMRPTGSAIVYPLDYGYLEGTTSMDGAGIDVWRGSQEPVAIVGVICTVDLTKRGSAARRRKSARWPSPMPTRR